MNADHVAIYLNDHLAGSVAALELLDYLEKEHANTPLAQFASELRAEIKADQRELEALMSKLQVSESTTRQATAWVAGKMSELKLKLDDPAGGTLRLFETLEALAVGIEGKRALWQALAAAAEAAPQLRVLDYQNLIQRAQAQRSQVEIRRLEAAKAALASETESRKH